MSETSPQAPKAIGRYALYDEIASGGMATVHFARLLSTGNFSRIVAAKRLLPQLVDDPSFTAMLLDEARIAARIRHPNVVSTLDVVATGRELVVVMEYVHGESLSRLMRTASDLGDPIPAPIATTIIVDALHGLHAAHQAKDEAENLLGLVHRDISPQNLLVGVDGITQVADFGVAFAAGRSQATQSGAVKGKLSYMAPEQIERKPLGAATDVFSISVVFWELLTGGRLFRGDNDGEIVHRILSGDAPAPSSVVAELLPAYDRILARGLSRDVAQRYATAREMALDLEQSTALVRPSEVAAWVQRTASDTLRRRARVITKIESTGAERPSEPEVPATKIAKPPLGLDAPGTGAQVSWARSEASKKAGGWQIAVGAAVAVAAAGVWLAARPRPPEHALPSRSVALVVPSLTTGAAAVEKTAASPSPAESSVGNRAPEAALPAAAALQKLKRPATSARARPRPSADCDPPYSIDAAGRRLFKLECL